MTIFTDKNVFGFKIAVHNSKHVEIFQSKKDLRNVESARRNVLEGMTRVITGF